MLPVSTKSLVGRVDLYLRKEREFAAEMCYCLLVFNKTTKYQRSRVHFDFPSPINSGMVLSWSPRLFLLLLLHHVAQH